MKSESIKEFCSQHRIQIRDTNKRASRYHKINVNYFRDPTDFNRIYENIICDSEPLYTIEIAESELERIAEFEQQVFNNAKKTGHYNLFHTIIEQKEREAFLRDKYPAVKKAYEQYSLILKLAESGEL